MQTKRRPINLGDPLGIVTLTALALPRSGVADELVVQTIRRVYELAHGRIVETAIGAIPVAPPVAPRLATAQFDAASRSELLDIVEEMIASTQSRRQLARANHFAAGSALLEFLDGRLGAPEFWSNGCRNWRQPEEIPASFAA